MNTSKSGPKVRPKIVKNWIFNEKVHRIRKPSQNRFSLFLKILRSKEVVHKRIFWNWGSISKSGPKLGQKLLKIESSMKRCIGSVKHHRSIFHFFARHYDAKEMIHKRISWNPEEVSQILGPNLGQKLLKIESSMKRCIRSVKPPRPILHFFARYYDAKEVIHKRICWNWANISKSGPKVRPKIVKNWIFNEMVHRIRKPSQNRLSLFLKILRC